MKVRLSRAAQTNLAEIGEWLCEHDPAHALAFVDEVEKRCLALARNPRRFPVVFDVNGQEIRKRSYRRYVILYRIASDEIRVDRIIHASRDWMALVEEFWA